jgi:hypothetical protein
VTFVDTKPRATTPSGAGYRQRVYVPRVASNPSRWWQLAGALAIIAVLLPVDALSRAFAGESPSAERMAEVVAGVWSLKGIVLLHAVAIALIARVRLPAANAIGLAPDSVEHADGGLRQFEIPLLVVLCAIGLALRLPALGTGLWIDEIEMYVKHVRLPLGQIVSTFDSQNQHLLYSILARLALDTGLDPELALRLPAVLFGVASLAAVVWFGVRITGRRETWTAACILAVSYHHVWFSQNARGYTGLLFLTIVGSGCFLVILSEPDRGPLGWIVAYAVTMALAHFVHITAAFVTAAHALIYIALLIATRRTLRRRGWAGPLAALGLAGTLSLLLYAPVLPQVVATLLAPTDGGSAGMWKSPSWLVSETLRVMSAGVPGGLVTVAVALGVVGVGIGSYVRQSRTLTAVMLLPLVLTGVVLLATAHNLWPRFFFFGAAFLVLIAVRGGFTIARYVMPRRGAAIATGGALVVAIASAFTVPRAWLPKQDYAGARTFVDSASARGDGFAGVDMTGLVYTRYYGRPWADLTSLDQLTDIETTHPRTWVLVTFPTRLEVIQPDLWQHLTRSYRTAATFPGTVGGGAIIVMVNR